MHFATHVLRGIRTPTFRVHCVAMCALLVSVSLWSRADAAGVVGDGTPQSCTAAALTAALSGGGTVTFNCGGPATIMIGTPLDISAPDTTIDGNQQITLQGSNTRIIHHHSLGSSSVLTLKNLAITGGRAAGTNASANGAGVQSVFEGANPPTSQPST